MNRFSAFTAAIVLASASSAHAVDESSCASGMICANTPSTVLDALKWAGYEAEMGSDDFGDPQITITGGIYNYDIVFYGCEEHVQCDSVQFFVGFEDDGNNTLELANDWNREKRLAKMAVSKTNQLSIRYDLSTRGGLNRENFEDVVDWWLFTLEEVNTYFRDRGLIE